MISSNRILFSSFRASINCSYVPVFVQRVNSVSPFFEHFFNFGRAQRVAAEKPSENGLGQLYCNHKLDSVNLSSVMAN